MRPNPIVRRRHRGGVRDYSERLGFEVEFTYGEPPFYGQVRRNQALLNLRLIRRPVFVDDIREREELLAASLTVGSAAEIRALFAEFQAAGVDFFRPLEGDRGAPARSSCAIQTATCCCSPGRQPRACRRTSQPARPARRAPRRGRAPAGCPAPWRPRSRDSRARGPARRRHRPGAVRCPGAGTAAATASSSM